MSDVLADRARIEGKVAGRTLVDCLADVTERFPDEPAFSDRHRRGDGESWRTLTWRQTHELALDVAGALLAEGIEPGGTVAVMATNRIEHVVADMGAVNAAAVPMSIYNTLAPD